MFTAAYEFLQSQLAANQVLSGGAVSLEAESAA